MGSSSHLKPCAVQGDGNGEAASTPAAEAPDAASQAKFEHLREEADLVMLVWSGRLWCCGCGGERLQHGAQCTACDLLPNQTL